MLCVIYKVHKNTRGAASCTKDVEKKQKQRSHLQSVDQCN